MKQPESVAIEVDMVPMIDIISLLLMFLLVVGSASKGECGVKMKLPRADQSLDENRVSTKGRLVVQLQPENGTYRAVINNKSYELVREGSRTLDDYLEKQINGTVSRGEAKRDAQTQAVDIPVKLRIPADAPMQHVELVIIALARAGLTNVQYASLPR
jgi:biopolymer transport protein ExbD